MLRLLLRFAASQQCRIDADQAPGADVVAPSRRPKVAPPSLDAFGIDALLQPDRQRRFANVVVAGNSEPWRGQTILLGSREGKVVFVGGSVERNIAAVYDQVRWCALHLLHKDLPIVDEVGALATDVRVRHLHDADGIVHGVSSAAVRSPILSRTPGSGSRPKRTVMSLRIEVVS